jgi:hypothetical protein
VNVQQIQYPAAPERYRPGVCNIGPEEITRRRRSGLFGLLIAAVIAVVLVAVGAPAWTRLLVFPFLAGGIVSLEQARRHFCAGFAMAGIRNFGPLGQRETVVESAALAADRRAASIMFGYSAVIGGVITLVFVLLPV